MTIHLIFYTFPPARQDFHWNFFIAGNNKPVQREIGHLIVLAALANPIPILEHSSMDPTLSYSSTFIYLNKYPPFARMLRTHPVKDVFLQFLCLQQHPVHMILCAFSPNPKTSTSQHESLWILELRTEEVPRAFFNRFSSIILAELH